MLAIKNRINMFSIYQRAVNNGQKSSAKELLL